MAFASHEGVHCAIMRTRQELPQITMRVRPSVSTARRIVPGVLALAFLWFARTAHLPGLAAAPDEPALVTLSIVGTSDLHGAAFPRNGARRSAPARRIREQSARGPRVRRRGGPADRLRRHVSGRRRVESQRGRPHRRRLQRDGVHRGGHRQPRFRFRIGRLADGATVAGRSARRSQSARRPGAISLPRGELDRRSDGPSGRVAERPAVGARRRGRDQGRHCRRHDDRCAEVDPRRQRSGTADCAAWRRRSPQRPSKLRAAGAEVVIVAAHAGGRCDRFDQPADLSSCDAESEIFQVARSLPHGLVDVIAAGHTHGGLAHQVDGIGIIQPFSRGQSFGRVDVVFDRRTRTRRADPALRTAAVCAAARSVTGTACRDRIGGAGAVRRKAVAPDPAIVAGDGAGAPARSSSSRQQRSASPLTPRFVEAATSDRRSETSLPRRSATRCRARTWRSSTTRRAVFGRISPTAR